MICVSLEDHERMDDSSLEASAKGIKNILGNIFNNMVKRNKTT